MAASVCVCALGVVIAISEDGANDMVANNAATAYIDGAVTIFLIGRAGVTFGRPMSFWGCSSGGRAAMHADDARKRSRFRLAGVTGIGSARPQAGVNPVIDITFSVQDASSQLYEGGTASFDTQLFEPGF